MHFFQTERNSRKISIIAYVNALLQSQNQMNNIFKWMRMYLICAMWVQEIEFDSSELSGKWLLINT